MASYLAPKVDGKEGTDPLGSSFIYVVILLSFFFFVNGSLSHLTLTEKKHVAKYMSWSAELFKSTKRISALFLHVGFSSGSNLRLMSVDIHSLIFSNHKNNSGNVGDMMCC